VYKKANEGIRIIHKKITRRIDKFLLVFVIKLNMFFSKPHSKCG
jgi:hypothetical protein